MANSEQAPHFAYSEGEFANVICPLYFPNWDDTRVRKGRPTAAPGLPAGIEYALRADMHELSIAMGIVDAALDEAQRRSVQVSAVHLRLGALSGVVKDALLFSYEVACQDTPLQGSHLIVEDVPVAIFCLQCKREQTLTSVQSIACPQCGTPTMDIRHGKELEVFALEVEDETPKPSEPQEVPQ